MPAIKIYDVFENDNWIGSYTADAITKLYNVPRSTIMSYASSGMMARKKYTFEVVTDVDKGTGVSTWAKEWDAARLRLLKAGGMKRGN